jgi:hypothetical protein
MRGMSTVRAGALALLAVLWACGGDVVVDRPGTTSGSGGGAASGSGASTGSGTGATPGAGPSSGTGAASTTGPGSAVGGGAPTVACGPACEAIAGCTAVDCLGGCSSNNPNCAFAFQPFLECVAGQTNPATCDLPGNCAPLLQSWLDCESWCIESFPCFEGSDGSCGCTIDNACGPVSTYETFCSPVGDGTSFCDCLADGQFVGGCMDDGFGTCEPLSGCCAALFFVPASSF